MGHGIAQEFARAGYDVVLWDRTEPLLQRAMGRIRRNLSDMAQWGLLDSADTSAIVGRIQTTTSTEQAASQADLIIEAVVENLELKREVFSLLDRLCPRRTILASNTSSLMPSVLAAATKRPERVLGTHFFYPAHLIPLVEIVRTPATSDEVVEAVRTVVEVAGKCPIVVQKEAPGFIANRLQAAIKREALYIVERGIASAQDVDTAVKMGFGRRLGAAGPIEMAEVGTGWLVQKEILSNIVGDISASREPSPLILEKIKDNELGPETGRGFYEWDDETLARWRERLERTLVSFLRSDRARQVSAQH